MPIAVQPRPRPRRARRVLALRGGAGRPWTNTALSPDRRADLLAQQMTLEQKVALFNPNGQVTVPELGIPPRHQVDATLGVHSSTQATTAFPAGSALAASLLAGTDACGGNIATPAGLALTVRR